MRSVFQILIQSEFGKSSYHKFSLLSNKYFENKYIRDNNETKDDNEKELPYNSWLIPIYEDIFNRIRKKDKETLDNMRDRLNETVELAIRIKRNFIPAMLFFIVAVFLVYFQNPNTTVTFIGIGLMTLSFIYKIAEYLMNKYCLIDKKIIMIYKLVLDTIYILEEIEESD